MLYLKINDKIRELMSQITFKVGCKDYCKYQLIAIDEFELLRKELEYKEKFELNLRDILPPTEYIYGSELEKARKVVNEYQWWKKHSGKTFILPYNRSDSAYLVLNENSKQSDRKTNIYKDGFVYTKTNSICNYTIPEDIPLDYEFEIIRRCFG